MARYALIHSFLILCVATGFLWIGCESPECKFDADCSPAQSGEQRRCLSGRCLAPTETPTPTDGSPSPDEAAPPVCQSGITRACYTGPVQTKDVGRCRSGTQKCISGAWGPCEGEVQPIDESCDTPEDDNCDGLRNEGCPCTAIDATRPCYKGTSTTKDTLPCREGIQRCRSDEVWSSLCEGQTLPVTETCNGIDDDCNGQIDDGCPCRPGETKACSVTSPSKGGTGICTDGLTTCRESQLWGPCVGAVAPLLQEACNGKDDNCDGQTDEGCQCKPGQSRECYTGPPSTLGRGICQKGRQSCDETGRWSACLGETLPQPNETCNGKDDDCNGKIDDAIEAPLCGLQKGICLGVRSKCGGEQGWLPCTPELYVERVKQYEENEVSCDNIDNDCDGQIDEALQRPCYSGTSGCQPSGKKLLCDGICLAGTQTCQTGRWGNCTGERLPLKETCNGQDDDCDGIIDNGCQCTIGATQDCYSGPAGTAGKGGCKKGTQTCLNPGRWSVCTGDQTPTDETCNGKDDDCNGKIDDNLTRTCYTGPTGTQGVGPCKQGQSLCQQGSFTTCQQQVLPTNERCNNKIDDDCDGQIDETDGRALLFKSQGQTQLVTIPHQQDYNLNGNFTLELWYTLDSISQSTNVALLLNKHKANDNANGYHLKVQRDPSTGPTCAFSWWDNTGGHQLLFVTCPLKTWNHIAFVYNKGTQAYSFFLNGKEVAKGKQDITIGANTYPLLLGTESNATADVHFNGQMAAIRITKGLRYINGFTPPCTFQPDTATAGAWNLDEGIGTTIKNIDPNQPTGTLSGPTWTKGRACNASTYGGCQ